MKEIQFGKRSKPYRDGLTFLVDDDIVLEGYSFCLNNYGYVMFSSHKDGLHSKLLHRWIMGFPDGKMIDHINHDPLDNRRCNLRVCSNQENQFNTMKKKNNTTGYKGVYFDKVNNKYVAQISINKKNKNLGRFEKAEDAYDAYCKKGIELFGEFFNAG